VAAFVLYSGAMLARETISPLLGETASPELRQLIVDVITSDEKILGYHDLMVHDYGPGQRFASIHAEMDCREDPLQCHERIDELERRCLQQHNIHLVIHYDPVITHDPELTRLRNVVEQLLQQLYPEISIHDFRMLTVEDRVRIFFDAALPPDLMTQKNAISKQLETLLAEAEPQISHIFITFDIVT
jgi:divalent metal cation (Fe/Co/Zn/Cd) transporter